MQKAIAIMQPYFMPYIGYFQLINAVDEFILLEDVNFIKKGWIHRNNILLNGQAHLFSIPLKGASQNKLIIDTMLSDNFEVWSKDFLKTLQLAYSKAPFYEDANHLIEEILLKRSYSSIAELNNYSLRQVANYLDIKTKFKSSLLYEKEDLKGQDRIIDICIQEKTNTYINLSGGKLLYNELDFKNHNIQLKFIQSKDIKYTQLKNDFIPNLSIIDLMMFNSKQTVSSFLNEFKIV